MFSDGRLSFLPPVSQRQPRHSQGRRIRLWSRPGKRQIKPILSLLDVGLTPDVINADSHLRWRVDRTTASSSPSRGKFLRVDGGQTDRRVSTSRLPHVFRALTRRF